jgi:hypothetical protein
VNVAVALGVRVLLAVRVELAAAVGVLAGAGETQPAKKTITVSQEESFTVLIFPPKSCGCRFSPFSLIPEADGSIAFSPFIGGSY